MVGCLGKLKDSIESFNQNYLQPGIMVDDVFNPKTVFSSDTFLLSHDVSSEDQSGADKAVYTCASPNNFYQPICNTCCKSATLHKNSKCPSCKRFMNVQMKMVMPKELTAETKAADIERKIGYVKEVVTYMVMDDLVVKPLSTISSITLINKFGVKDLSQLEEMTVYFGKDQGLKLLMASLKTDKVLTKFFLH